MPDPVPLATVRKMLTDEGARRPLPREAMLSLQHAEIFARLTPEETDKLVGELKALPFVEGSIAVKVADMLPQYPEEIRLLFAKERIVLDEAQITQVLETVAKFK